MGENVKTEADGRRTPILTEARSDRLCGAGGVEHGGGVIDYAKPRPVFDGYKSALYSKKYLAEHGDELYWLSEDYWRRVITSRAVRMICKEVFISFDIIRTFAEPFDYDAGSRSVLEKAGFTYEGGYA